MAARIALLVPSLRGGGAERVMVSLANAFAQRGFTVDLLVCTLVGPYRDEVARGVRVVDLGATRVAFALRALTSYLRRERPDALLSTMAHANVVAILARLLARAGSTRLVVRDALPISQERGSSRWLGPMAALAYRYCDAVVFVSDCQRRRFFERTSLGPDVEAHVILNPVSIDRIVTLADAGPLPESTRPTVLAVGRLNAQKGFDTLIDAFVRVRREHVCDLVILGEGDERNALLQRVARHGLEHAVRLPGFVPNPFPHVRAASLFVLSSRWEGMPNALLQAVALGTPAIATNCDCGPDEVLMGGRVGALVPVDDIDALATAMLDRLRRGGRVEPDAEWRERFSFDTAVLRYLHACRLPASAHPLEEPA